MHLKKEASTHTRQWANHHPSLKAICSNVFLSFKQWCSFSLFLPPQVKAAAHAELKDKATFHTDTGTWWRGLAHLSARLIKHSLAGGRGPFCKDEGSIKRISPPLPALVIDSEQETVWMSPGGGGKEKKGR